MAIVRYKNCDISFSDSDVCNPDDAIWQGESNPHNKHLFLLHDHGFTVAVVWADHLQDALDEACDQNKLERYLVTEDQSADYGDDIWNCESLTYLGNASEPHDIESLGYVEFAPPKLSLSALFGDEPIKAISGHFA